MYPTCNGELISMTMKKKKKKKMMMMMMSRYLKSLNEPEGTAPLLLLLLLLLEVRVVVVAVVAVVAEVVVVVIVAVVVVGVAAVLVKQISLFETIGERMWQFCQPHATALFIPQKTLLVLISVRG
jgi:hypothetical protein